MSISKDPNSLSGSLAKQGFAKGSKRLSTAAKPNKIDVTLLDTANGDWEKKILVDVPDKKWTMHSLADHIGEAVKDQIGVGESETAKVIKPWTKMIGDDLYFRLGGDRAFGKVLAKIPKGLLGVLGSTAGGAVLNVLMDQEPAGASDEFASTAGPTPPARSSAPPAPNGLQALLQSILQNRKNQNPMAQQIQRGLGGQ